MASARLAGDRSRVSRLVEKSTFLDANKDFVVRKNMLPELVA